VGTTKGSARPQTDQAVSGISFQEDPGSRNRAFRTLSRKDRLAELALEAGLDGAEVRTLLGMPLSFANADQMVENAVGVLGVPLGVALNFVVNGREHVVPMAIEEPSVIAAASYGARIVRDAGGFTASAEPPVMIGQLQIVNVRDLDDACARLREATPRLLALADDVHPNLVARGGGARAIELRPLPDTPCGPMLVVHLLVDVVDAMGANAVNAMVEAMAPVAGALAGGEPRLRILSNLADRRLARASAAIPVGLLRARSLDGAEVARRVVEAWALAAADPYRAATHNKGIMNGVDAVALATGNDWRGIEAGAHAYAARDGRYGPLSQWQLDGEALVGTIELPLAVATVGGHLDLNPRVRLALQILGLGSARELAAVMAAVGLAQNLAALRALVTDGIQRGHMALHARGVVASAGVPPALRAEVTERLIASGEIKLARARAIFDELAGRSR
jgi:hydroxymethylglutaryl-CoA reductase